MLLSVPILLPFSTERVMIAGVPLYIPEIAVLFVLTLLLVLEGKSLFSGFREVFFSFPFPVRVALSLILIGSLSSALVNRIPISAYGELKSWYGFPILFAFLLALWVYRKNIRINDIALSIVLSGILFALQAILALVFSDTAMTYDGRLRGIFDSPNQLAFSLALPLFFSISLFREKKSGILLGGVILFFGGMILATHSYAAIAGVIGGLFLVLWTQHAFLGLSKKKLIVCYVGLAFLVSAFFLSEKGSEKWQSLIVGDERSSIASREMIWRSAAMILSDYPFFGIGQGNFQEKYLEYQQFFPPYLEWSAPHPHNLFLALWLDAGILGFLGMILLFFATLKKAFSFAEKQKSENEAVLLACLGFGTFLFFSGMVDVPMYRNNLAFTFWLGILGIFLFSERKTKE